MLLSTRGVSKIMLSAVAATGRVHFAQDMWCVLPGLLWGFGAARELWLKNRHAEKRIFGRASLGILFGQGNV